MGYSLNLPFCPACSMQMLLICDWGKGFLYLLLGSFANNCNCNDDDK
jgi:hypothetical protein